MRKYIIFFIMDIVQNCLSAQAVDSASIRQVDSLIQVSRELTAKNDFQKAIELNAIAEKLALEKFGNESSAYGRCCFNRGRVNDFKGDNQEAEKCYLESKAIQEKVLGKEHLDYANTLNNLAILYSNMGNYEKAGYLFLEVKPIWEKLHGREHPDYIGTLINLAIIYNDIGQDDKAEKLFLEAKVIFENTNNLKHPYYMNCLANLAILYHSMGQFEKAEPIYLESKALVEKVLGKDNPNYSGDLINLASLYKDMGQFEKAEPLFLDAKVILENTNNLNHPFYHVCLRNLANLNRNIGQYGKAEQLLLKSIAIEEKVLGNEHPNYANSLNSLANLYWDLGQYEKAEVYHLECKAIREKVLGKEHPDYAGSLNDMANVYTDMGQFKKAEQLLLTSIAIYEKVLGKEHPNYANSLNSLANLYDDMGHYEKLEPLYLEAKVILEKNLGREHHHYATILNNLAAMYENMGQYDKAEQLLLESKTIIGKKLDKEHPIYALSQINLASLYKDMGQYDKAESHFMESSSIDKRLIARAVHHLSEKELSNYLNKFIQSQNEILSFVQLSNRKKAVTACYDNTLFYKGFLLNAFNQVKHLALYDSTSTEKFNLLKSYKRRLANEYSVPLAERDSAKVAELEEKANALEKFLVRTVAGFGDAMRQVNYQEVQANLKEGEAAIEFVHYRYYDQKATDSMMYAALVLRKEIGTPVFIPLFEQGTLDSLLRVQNERKADYVNSLYTIYDRGVIAIETPKKSLYEILWKPLEKELTGIKTIYFSPSGLLHRINLDAVPASETETLADRYNLIELNSTRQLMIPAEIKNINNDAALFGGIQYEKDTTLQNMEPTLAFRSRDEISFSFVDSTLRGGSWNYLPHTEREVNSIEKLMLTAGMKVNLNKGYQGTENSFKNIGANNIPSPRILHIATHGYFFPDPKTTIKNIEFNGQNEPVFKISDHPMLRSGLIMAGGNAAWQGKQTLEGREDGILTAYEISQMNLSNTELVVLSACETGLGDIQGNEGVYGLQRAFKIAGAKYLIMSLWQVPDKQTSLLMTTFYKKWLEAEGSPTGEKKMSIPDAFHAAQKELREIGLDPYQWAGFVLVE